MRRNRMLDRPYQSTKAAIAAAANFSRPLDLPASSSIRVDSAPDGDGLDRPIAVRAALVAAGIDLDSEDAELLFDWARRADDGRDEDDVLAETAKNDREARDALERGAARRSRLVSLAEAIEPLLIEAGVVVRPPKLAMLKVGWRVVIEDGQRKVVTVVDPSPLDRGVYTGPDGERHAHRVARGEVEGEVSEHTRLSVPRRKHPEIAADMVPRWEAGEFAELGHLDTAIADLLGCGIRWARRVRESWGIEGSRGAAPTRPPKEMSEDAA
jgi:hypothetical protein